MRLSHAELLKSDRLYPGEAHQVIACTLKIDLDTAGKLFAIMRIMGFIEDCADGRCRAARTPASGSDSHGGKEREQ